MNAFTQENLRELLTDRPLPCLSIFLPARPGQGEQTQARWRSCLSTAREMLTKNGSRAALAAEFLAPAQALLADGTVARQQGGGLAYFLAPGFQHLYNLPLAFEERVAVGERFLVTPLLPLLGGNGMFHVLALSRNRVRLLRCTREEVSAVALPGVPANIDEALATHDVDEPLNFHSRPLGAGRWAGIFHGHGVGIDDAKDDLLLYFRKIERGLRPVLNESRAPLVLAGVGYLLPLYRQVSNHPGLLETGLEGCPDRLSDQELHRLALPLVEPIFRRGLEKSLEVYRQLKGTGRTAFGVETLVPAAYRGEVETLFVARDRSIWGMFDPSTGRAEPHETRQPQDEDLLNVAAIQALRHGATVHMLPAAEMPDGDSLDGIYWLPLTKHRKGP